jgi:hypothetical protein
MAIDLYSKATLDTLLAAKLSDAPSDGTTYGRKDAAWVAVSGVAWGAITGTVTDQTDLVTYVTGLGYQTASDVSTSISANAYPLSGNPSGFLTSVPAKSVNMVTSGMGYYIQHSDCGNIIIDSTGANPVVDFIGSPGFPAGKEILFFNHHSGNVSVTVFGGTGHGSNIPANSWGTILIDSATATVYYS